MAHPNAEAAPTRGDENTPTTPHATKAMTIEEAAAELSTYFEDSPEEQKIANREQADQSSLARDLKNLKLDQNGNPVMPEIDGDPDTEEFDKEPEDEENRPDYQEDNPDIEEEQDEGTETEDEDTVIPAPVSWSKEQKQIFDALPPEAKNIIVERERERDKGFQVKATELATERKQLQALEQQTIKERQMYAEVLSDRIAAEMVTPDEGLLDPQSPAYNPAEYYAQKATYDQLVAQHREMQQRADAYATLFDHNNQFAAMEHMKENEYALSQTIPGWTDATERHHIIDYGGQYGFSPTEIQSASPVEVMLLSKAMRFDELMAQKPNVQSQLKRAPKVQKPGAKSRHSANKRSLAAAQKKLKRSGSVEDAATVLSHIMKD